MKMPPREKIPEAYSAIIDGRVEMHENYALVTSSDHQKVYLVRWQGNTYNANDNATYWQGYPGYPVIAVLLMQGKLPYNEDVARYFQGVNWHRLNKKKKRDYAAALADVLLDVVHPEGIYEEIDKVYTHLSLLDLTLTRKKL